MTGLESRWVRQYSDMRSPSQVVGQTLGTFCTLLRRDLTVMVREPWGFLAQSLVQPFFMMFLFGQVLSGIGVVNNGYGSILLPGIAALNAFLVALQNTAMPLVMDFAHTREIDDRLLAPISVVGIAAEKVLFGALRGLISACLIIPIGILVLPGVSWPISLLWLAITILAMGATLGASIGLFVGTVVPPRNVSVAFTAAVTPLVFTGAVQYPWASLHGLPWFQVVCAINPLTYFSEGMRALLLGPQVPSLSLSLDVLVIIGGILVFGVLGVRKFSERALD